MWLTMAGIRPTFAVVLRVGKQPTSEREIRRTIKVPEHTAHRDLPSPQRVLWL